VTLALAFAVDLLVSRKLWLSSRTYPLAPVWDRLPPIRAPWDAVCLAILFALLTATIIARPARPYLIAFVGFVAAYSLWDQARWMAPVYQYTILLAALSWYPERRPNPAAGEAVLNACRIVLAATYVWAGIQKVNVTFIREGFPWMLQPLVGALPDRFRGWPFPLGLGVALTEAGIGVGLLFAPTRRMAVVAAVAMHAFILISLGPLGHGRDLTVWPWNLATAVLVVLLFWRTEHLGARQIVRVRPRWLRGAVVGLFAVMPALGMLGVWDADLSAEFYTGATRYGVMVMTDAAKAALPAELRPFVERSRSGEDVLDLTRWAFVDRNVEPYPEVRVFKATARALCRYAVDPTAMALVIHERAQWRTGRRTATRYPCAELDGGSGPAAARAAHPSRVP
jgi:hypothetical protein